MRERAEGEERNVQEGQNSWCLDGSCLRNEGGAGHHRIIIGKMLAKSLWVGWCLSSMAVLLKSVIIWLTLLITALLGDILVEKITLELPPKSLLRATDTAVHGLIGGFSFWLTCILCPELVLDVSYVLSCLGFENKWNKQRIILVDIIFNFSVAFMVSCIVDLDHIYKDIIHLIITEPRVPWMRGFLHYSLPPLVLTFILYISAVVKHSMECLKLGTLIVVCIFSHHVRDGMHHGLWFQPLGTTSQLPQWLYIFITQMLPLGTSVIASILLSRVKPSVSLPDEMYIV